jgi:hypothetical protein
MPKVAMQGFVQSVSMKMGASSDLVKEVKLDVHGDMASLQELMKQPLTITFEPMQATFGAQPPERRGSKRERKDK